MADLISLLSARGATPKRVSSTKGGEYHGPCPSCGGTDRFHVWPAQNDGQGSYWCRGCDKKGDLIQFLRDFDGLGYREACVALGLDPKAPEAQRQGPEIQKWRAPALPGDHKPTKKDRPVTTSVDNATWARKAADFSSWAANRLGENSDVVKWLADRGIDADTAARFRLGWNPGDKGRDLVRPRPSWGLEETGKKLWLPVGLVIPQLWDDRVLRLRIRRTAGEPRYYVVPGSTMGCLSVDCQGARAIVVVESELDALTIASQARGMVGVIALGNNSRKPDDAVLPYLTAASVVLVSLDADDGGETATKWWLDAFHSAADWPVPVGKDPGEAYAAGVRIADWIAAGLPAAWRVEAVPNKAKAAQPDQTKSNLDGHNTVRRLSALMDAPENVLIVVEDNVIRVHAAPAWADANRDRLNEITRLVNYDPMVRDMIARWDINKIDCWAVAVAAQMM